MFSIGLNTADVRKVIWTAIQAFVASFLATASGWGALPNMATAKAALVSAGIAAIAAAFSLLKNLVLSDGSPIK